MVGRALGWGGWAGLVYTHPGLRDVQMYVRKLQWADEKRVKLSVIWVDKKGNVIASDRVQIKREDLGNWRVV